MLILMGAIESLFLDKAVIFSYIKEKFYVWSFALIPGEKKLPVYIRVQKKE